jgi:hypothetical protein
VIANLKGGERRIDIVYSTQKKDVKHACNPKAIRLAGTRMDKIKKRYDAILFVCLRYPQWPRAFRKPYGHSRCGTSDPNSPVDLTSCVPVFSRAMLRMLFPGPKPSHKHQLAISRNPETVIRFRSKLRFRWRTSIGILLPKSMKLRTPNSSASHFHTMAPVAI